jgi:HD-GYP domain-containing protein (c-di-GMP phosphodiesterase class II)
MAFMAALRRPDDLGGRWFDRRPAMSRHVRVFGLLVFTQAACLAVGLWVESRFVGSLMAAASGRTSSASLVDTIAASQGQAVASSDELPAVEVSAAAMKVMVFFWIAALQGVIAYLVLSRVRTEASRKQSVAASEACQRQNDLIRTRDAVIFGLAKLAESRDPETGCHLERITLYATRLATALRGHPRYGCQINATFVKLIGISAALHDIGKVGVKDSVLLKVGGLSPTEREAIERHPEIGAQCLEDIERRLGSSNFLQLAREIALSHHERWDGTGYPRRTAGTHIPLSARIVAICDVYDALTSRRVYKDRLPHEKCVAIIREGAGSQFDPVLVDVFLEIQSELGDIARRCADPVVRQDADDGDVVGASELAAPAADFEAIVTILGEPPLSPAQEPSLDLLT